MGIKFRQRIFLLLVLFCTSLLTSQLHAALKEESLVTEVTIADDKRNLGPSVQWIEDPSGELTFEQVQGLASKQFSPSDAYTFNQGYTPSSYWLKFQIEFPAELIDSHWLLEIPFPLLDYVALYTPDANNNYSVIYTGDRSSFSQRDIDTTDFVFNVRPKQQSNTYFIHVRTQDSLQVPLFLWAENAYPKHNALATGLQGAYFGIMIVMIFYNLFIFLSVRDLSYLYYIGYISCFTIFQSSMEGYSFEYIWPNNTWWANINIPFLGVLSLFFAALFARNMLNTKDLLPRLDKVIQLLTGSLFIILPIILFGSYKLGIYTALITSFLFFNLILFTALLAAYKGDRTAKVFAIAWSIFLIGGGIGLLGMLDILPLQYASQTGIQIGSALEVILLSLALADRINLIEKEKTEIEAHSKTMLLEANKQLENSNRVKDEFIATISHEIRTPMNGILGSTQLLADTDLKEDQTIYIDTINSSGTILIEILNNILDYSKIEANKLTIESSQFLLEDLINECANFFSAVSAQNQVKLFIRIHKGTPKVIQSDPLRLKQILLNLLSNAFKYTSRGQIVVHVQLDKNNPDKLLIEVEDSGSGLSYEQQDMLFQPFVQVDGSSSREKGGTGLGLAICKKLTLLMGGDVGVHSLPGEGATFWFTTNIKVIEQGDIENHSETNVCILLDGNYQESLIKEQLEDWGVSIISRHLIKYDHSVSIISNKNHLNELLELGIPESNLIIISNDNQPKTDYKHNINSPITPNKLRASLLANSTYKAALLKTAPIEPKATPDFSQLKVLAVDDNGVNRMIINKMLQKYKIAADIVEGGIEAMDIIKQQQKHYDLILMDIEMPVKDGYQTTQEIRQFEQENNLTASNIIAVSAHSMKESRGKVLISGMEGFLSKPIDQNILIDILTMARSHSLSKQ